MMVNHTARNPIRSVYTAFEIIEQLKENDSATVTQLANELETPTSTVHNYLSTLRELGYVVQDESGYHLALRFAHLGDSTKYRLDLCRVAEPMLEHLAEQSQGTVNLMAEENGRGIYLLVKNSERMLHNYSYTRPREYLHSTAAGKAILANLDRSQVDSIIDVHGLPSETETTITDRTELFEELEQIRDRGYAINDQESTEGIYAVAAPLQHDGTRAAVSVSGSIGTFGMETFRTELSEKVCRTAKSIELDLTE